MQRDSIVAAIVGVVLGVAVCSAQITSYVDEKGRRVYINADPPPVKPAAKTKRSHRRSLLVRRDPRTNRLIPIPPPPDPIEDQAKTVPADTKQAEKPVAAAQEASQAISERAAEGGPAPAENLDEAARGNLDVLIQDTAERHSVDPNLVRAIVKVESNFNPYAISHKGAMGLMQLMPDTARELGVRNVFDPVENLGGGVRYLKYLIGLYKDLRLSLAAYNAGQKAVERHNGIPPYPETRAYVHRISSLYRLGNLAAPFELAGEAGSRGARDRWGIMKRVDEKGQVHFSNTEGW